LPLEQPSPLTSNAALTSCWGVFPSIPASCASSCQFVSYGSPALKSIQRRHPTSSLDSPLPLPRRCRRLPLMSFRRQRRSTCAPPADTSFHQAMRRPESPPSARFSTARSPLHIHPQSNAPALDLREDRREHGHNAIPVLLPSRAGHSFDVRAPRKRHPHASRDIVLVSRGRP
jgi:hypothetical protein